MELDEIKNLWENEKSTETPEISLEKQKEIHLPLEKIRKNMRMEFWGTTLFFVFTVLFFVFKDFYIFRFKIYIITLVSVMMMITSFYYYKFFLLYKNISENHLNTMDNLKDLNFQFQLNKQYYLSFYLAFAPFIVCEMLLIFDYVPYYKSLVGLKFVLMFLGVCSMTILLLYTGGSLWFSHFYGKHIKKIENLIKQLK